MKPLTYGFVGLNHGRSHLNVVSKLPGAEVGAICDLSSDLLNKYREEYDLAPDACYSSIDAMLENPSLDVLVVATPVHTHKTIALKAVEAGKHLLLEKPLAHTLEDGLAIVDAATNADTVTQIGYCVRSSALVDKLLAIRDHGQIGNIVLIWFNMIMPNSQDPESWRADRKKSGGKLFDCCCHYFDMMFRLTGSRFSRVCAFGGPAGCAGVNANDLPKVANVIVDMENGVKITLNLSEETPCLGYSHFGIAGTRGKADIDPFFPDGAGSIDLTSDGCLYQEKITISGKMTSTGHLGFAEQHRNFYASICDGKPVICMPADAMEIVYLNTAIDQSLATGKVISRQELE